MLWGLFARVILLLFSGAVFLGALGDNAATDRWPWQILKWLGVLFWWIVVAGLFWTDVSGQFERLLFREFEKNYPRTSALVRWWLPRSWLTLWALVLVGVAIISYC